jgi:hypothetical protein
VAFRFQLILLSGGKSDIYGRLSTLNQHVEVAFGTLKTGLMSFKEAKE